MKFKVRFLTFNLWLNVEDEIWDEAGLTDLVEPTLLSEMAKNCASQNIVSVKTITKQQIIKNYENC